VPHMVAQQHMGQYDCIRAGTARTHTTISAALTAIGSTPTTLVLTFAGDGIWSIGANLTIPSTIVLLIPAGVTVNRASGVTLTLNGPVISYQPGWETGPGTTVRSLTPGGIEINALATEGLAITQPSAPGGLLLQASAASTAKRVRLFCDQGGGNVGMSMSQNETVNTAGWQIAVVVGGGLTFSRATGTYIAQINDNGLAIGGGLTPSSYLLQLNADSAGKPGAGGLWAVVSSREVKDILGDYTEGLALLRQLPHAVRFRYNGRGGTPADGPEDIGFVAEDLQAVAPRMVREVVNPHAEAEPDLPTMLSTNLGEILYVLINAVLELDRRGSEAPEETPADHAPATPQRRRRAA